LTLQNAVGNFVILLDSCLRRNGFAVSRGIPENPAGFIRNPLTIHIPLVNSFGIYNSTFSI
jgi:hypothetical protein